MEDTDPQTRLLYSLAFSIAAKGAEGSFLHSFCALGVDSPEFLSAPVVATTLRRTAVRLPALLQQLQRHLEPVYRCLFLSFVSRSGSDLAMECQLSGLAARHLV